MPLFKTMISSTGRLAHRRLFQQMLQKANGQHQLQKSENLHTSGVYFNTPVNTIIKFVPQQEAWVVERMGKFHRILEPGLNILMPIIDQIKYVQVLKEIAIDIPKQSAVTSDNVTLSIDGVLYLRINDPYLASYGVQDPEYAVVQLAQTTMRSTLGQITLDGVFREREQLNITIVEAINKASTAWGIACLRYEIRDIKLPPAVMEAMQMQVEAERRKRAQVLESEGIRESEINVAEGKRQSRILASEAEKVEQINKAQGLATALRTEAEGKAEALRLLGERIRHDGFDAVSMSIAEQYVKAFSNLARTNNTLILNKDAGNVSNMVAQAMAIFTSISKQQQLSSGSTAGEPSTDHNLSNLTAEYYSDEEDLKRDQKNSSNPTSNRNSSITSDRPSNETSN